jgi:dephospho-CoA kinase
LTLTPTTYKLVIVKVIGITGGIGSGKSEVAGILKELGAGVIDADKVGHEILNPGTPGWHKVTETFGKYICDQSGKIDRKKLAKIVFQNAESVDKINKITHPLILNEIKLRLNKMEAEGFKVAVVEAALLIEAGWAPLMDQIWLSLTPKEITLSRLMKRGLSESEAKARISAQVPGETKINQVTEIILNDGSIIKLRKKVAKLWTGIHNDN